MAPEPLVIEKEIKARAASLGFSVCGITTPNPLDHHHEYVEWIQRGLHADMHYLSTPYHISMREYPENLYTGLKSIIVLGLSYPLQQAELSDGTPVGAISGYATGEDYHTRIPQMVAPLLDFITSLDPVAPAPRIFTDSAPILERELAVRSGLGWIGRNSCLISPSHGSNILLAEVFTAIPLEADPIFSTDHCGNCDRCLVACPTNCIQPDRKIDTNRCLSYHSIENRGNIPDEIMEKIGSWIFGCDVCQAVCPWNHHNRWSVDAHDKAEHLTVEEMLEFLASSPAGFDRRYGETAIARTKFHGLMRNIIIRLANLREARALELLRTYKDGSGDPVLQKTAVWARKKIQGG